MVPGMGLSVSAGLFQGVMGNEWIALAVFHGITAADSGRRLMADAVSVYLPGSDSLRWTSHRQPEFSPRRFAITEKSPITLPLKWIRHVSYVFDKLKSTGDGGNDPWRIGITLESKQLPTLSRRIITIS